MDLPVTVEAPAKLTLSLRITGVRDDGYHLVDAVMVSLDLADTLVIGPGDDLIVDAAATGLEVPASDDNLVRRALALVGRRADVHLTKRIPAGRKLLPSCVATSATSSARSASVGSTSAPVTT